MIRFGKKIFIGIVVIIMSFYSVLPCLAEHKDYTNNDLKNTMEKIIQWKKKEQGIKYKNLLSSDFANSAGTTAEDWYAFALGRIGYEDDYGAYLSAIKINLGDTLKKGNKTELKPTDFQRIALTVLSLGGNIEDFIDDFDLLYESVYNLEIIEKQGVNAYIWALITVDSMKYKADKNEPEIRQKLIDKILEYQCEDGGFALDKKMSDVDITAMALQALSPYYSKYEDEINSALSWISSVQNDDGTFSVWGNDSLESVAQVIVALCSMGISPDSDLRFIKNGNTLLDVMMKYKMSDGGFAHTLYNESNESNSMATAQALYSLCAVFRYRAKLNKLYDFTGYDNGNGFVVNIFTNKNVSADFEFSESDVNEIMTFPKKLTGEYYDEIARLFVKLKSSDNKDDYKYIYNQLEDMYNQVLSIRQEVERINSEIAENLYPFDDIGSEDKQVVNKLVDRVDKLSEYDKSQVLGYDDLVSAKAKIDSKSRSVVIFVSIGVVVLATVIVLVIHKKKKREKKNAEIENDEW